MLVYRAELEFACLYSLRRPKLAKECAQTAHEAALAMCRPDLAWTAAELMGAL